MSAGIIFTLIIVGGVVCSEVLSCDSCGRECAAACGTRQFRTCCFNYLRKRTSSPTTIFDSSSQSIDPSSLRLELWLAARTRSDRYAAPLSPHLIRSPSKTNQDKEDFNALLAMGRRIPNSNEYPTEEDGADDYNTKSM